MWCAHGMRRVLVALSDVYSAMTHAWSIPGVQLAIRELLAASLPLSLPLWHVLQQAHPVCSTIGASAICKAVPTYAGHHAGAH